MMDFEKARTIMVDCQIRTCDVTEHNLIDAFLQVPREEFVEKKLQPLAYIDEDLSIGEGRYLTEPAPLAQLLQSAKISKDDIVLVIGSGCGYSSAVISLMASSVVALEVNDELAETSSEKLSALGYDNVAVVTGPHSKGYQKEAPFDVIFIDGAVEKLPEVILDQLANNGRLVTVVGTGNAAEARVYTNENGNVGYRNTMNACIKPLPGFEKEAEFVF